MERARIFDRYTQREYGGVTSESGVERNMVSTLRGQVRSGAGREGWIVCLCLTGRGIFRVGDDGVVSLSRFPTVLVWVQVKDECSGSLSLFVV